MTRIPIQIVNTENQQTAVSASTPLGKKFVVWFLFIAIIGLIIYNGAMLNAAVTSTVGFQEISKQAKTIEQKVAALESDYGKEREKLITLDEARRLGFTDDNIAFVHVSSEPSVALTIRAGRE
jgi:hypothetical protein